MITKAYFTERPESIKFMPLPSGDADLWLRKNIAEITDPETNEVSYEADEAYMRTDATKAEIEADFEGWFETTSEWQPTQPEPDPGTEDERIAALEGKVKTLEAENTALDKKVKTVEKENAALAEELQATKIILGVE